MENKNVIIVILFTIVFSINVFAQEANVVLKNSKVVVGRIIEEKPDYLLLDSELGQLRIDRQSISSISYNPFIKFGTTDDLDNTKSEEGENLKGGQRFVINDPVVVYLRNGNIVAGLLLAKSLNMIMLQTESGNLTIPKRDLSKIEYMSSEFAERGEIVVARLNNGQRFEGNIYFEDSNELTLDTELGRLTFPKSKLRTLEYTGKTGISKMTMADQYSSLVISKRLLVDRLDVIDVGYTTKFGTTYSPGFGFGYQSKFNLYQFEGLDLSALGGLSMNYFALNKDNIIARNPTLTANLKGGALITTLSAGGQINVYPQTASFYDFYVAPVLEGHLIYKKLDQTYPSYPQFNTSESSTEFKFGIGTRFGVEFLFDSFRLGAQYNLHFIFGSDGFNQFSLTFSKQLF